MSQTTPHLKEEYYLGDAMVRGQLAQQLIVTRIVWECAWSCDCGSQC